MSIDGTYGFVYCGNRGLGIGVLSITDGHIEGRDFAGCTYNGSAVQDGNGNIQLDVQIHVSAGVKLAPGTAAQDLPHTRQISWTFPPSLGDGEPQMVEFVGPVTVMVKRIPDSNAAVAQKGFTPETTARLGGFIIP